jgi:hypothetical protein
VICACVTLADTVFHQARQAWQTGDRRIDTTLEEVSIQYDLSFRDVPGEIGDGMADVVRRHGENGTWVIEPGELRDLPAVVLAREQR